MTLDEVDEYSTSIPSSENEIIAREKCGILNEAAGKVRVIKGVDIYYS